MTECQNKIFEPDGYCGWCGKKHQTRTMGRRKTPVMVNGVEFKRKRPKYRRIVSVNEAKWIREKEKCPRCQCLLWLQIKRDADGEEYVEQKECRSCNWRS